MKSNLENPNVALRFPYQKHCMRFHNQAAKCLSGSSSPGTVPDGQHLLYSTQYAALFPPHIWWTWAGKLLCQGQCGGSSNVPVLAWGLSFKDCQLSLLCVGEPWPARQEVWLPLWRECMEWQHGEGGSLRLHGKRERDRDRYQSSHPSVREPNTGTWVSHSEYSSQVSKWLRPQLTPHQAALHNQCMGSWEVKSCRCWKPRHVRGGLLSKR